MENIIKYLSLSFTKGIGRKTVKDLLEICKSINNITKNIEILERNFSKATIEKLINALEKPTNKVYETLELAQKHNVKLLTLESSEYPDLLKEIPDPPIVLYVKGNINNFQKNIAVVGTRKPSNYGKNIAKTITEFLVNYKITTVSGGAIGIDTIAHKTTLENKGKTIVVLGSGIDILYPYSNKKLFEEVIEKGGTIISEFPFKTKPSKYTFPIRNKTVAGLSFATIVIEAPEKSGSLITASLANQYGRVVFAVPHNINNPKGKGCNQLIKEGASIVTNLEDIPLEIPYLFNNLTAKKENSVLSEEEIKVLDAIEDLTSLDEIIQKTNFDLEVVLEILTNLEINGYIINQNGIYQRL